MEREPRASILHYFREIGSAHLVDDSCGLHSVKLEQKTLQGYLEMAFVAGESAEFERLDRRAKQGDPIAKEIARKLIADMEYPQATGRTV